MSCPVILVFYPLNVIVFKKKSSPIGHPDTLLVQMSLVVAAGTCYVTAVMGPYNEENACNSI